MFPDKDLPMSEEQSFHLIRQMIDLSKKKMKNDGILFILWGWVGFINYFVCGYLSAVVPFPYKLQYLSNILSIVLLISGFAYTVYYLFQQSKKYQSYISISVRYVWITLLGSMVLINLIQFNVLHAINFELQHPIFMVLIAFAIIVTGAFLRYQLLIYGGVTFAILAYVASYFALPQQLLVEAIGWLIAFIISGHIMYSQRNQ